MLTLETKRAQLSQLLEAVDKGDFVIVFLYLTEDNSTTLNELAQFFPELINQTVDRYLMR